MKKDTERLLLMIGGGILLYNFLMRNAAAADVKGLGAIRLRRSQPVSGREPYRPTIVGSRGRQIGPVVTRPGQFPYGYH